MMEARRLELVVARFSKGLKGGNEGGRSPVNWVSDGALRLWRPAGPFQPLLQPLPAKCLVELATLLRIEHTYCTPLYGTIP